MAYTTAPPDGGTDVTVRCIATLTGESDTQVIEADETFRVLTGDARAPELSFEELDGEHIVGGTFRTRVIHLTPGNYDGITYQWELGPLDVGTLTAEDDIATYTVPDLPFVAGTAYCVTFTVTATVVGSGVNATDGTTDTSMRRLITRIRSQ